jgi:formylglycine-generating enzyme required for sulfatase activity/tetratricopeptide (TPR) repeat protein
MEVSRQTREVIASNEALARENIQAMEAASDRLSSTMEAGFSQLSYDLQDISAGISELNATFHWGFGQMIAEMGHMNDALSELIKIAKTPVQTVAFNHFEIARDAYRQQLYEECLEALDKAISGDHTSPGYKLEWRFHQMKGTIQLGFADGDLALMDHAKAEETFLLAARYAKADYPEHAGQAFLSAGWAAYCQGRMKEALSHTEQAIGVHPRLGEAFFQAAKVRMALGEVDAALPILGKAIDLDRFYALKAAGDGDFQKHDKNLRDFLEALRMEKYRQSVPLVKAALEKLRFWREHSADASRNEAVKRMDAFLAEGSRWPLLDMLAVVQDLENTLGEIEGAAKGSLIIVTEKVSSNITRSREETYPVEEVYEEEVVIKPGGFFKKAIKEKRTATRTVMKTRTVNIPVESIRDDFYQGLGEKIASIEFCPIQAGTFKMGEGNNSHKVTISKDFYLGKYLVTQSQWEAVMGNNPSNFKGTDRPVENVSWDDCQQFIEKLNSKTGDNVYRLPTEAEWEYACRAGTNTVYFFGDSESLLGEYSWYGTNSGNETHPVGQKKPNAWGLFDIHGNVWEWCLDWYGDYPSGPVTDPKGPSSGSYRVNRGGSWDFDARRCQSADRGYSSPDFRYNGIGFRLVRMA